MLFFLPDGMLDIPSEPSHPGTFLIGIAKTVPVICDMELIL
jgi:hypothetical protein